MARDAVALPEAAGESPVPKRYEAETCSCVSATTLVRGRRREEVAVVTVEVVVVVEAGTKAEAVDR